jgi:hypothetical protein
MYVMLRNLHLAAGSFAAVWLLAYALSAAQMACPLCQLTPTETVTTIDVPDGVATSPRAFARWLMTRHGLRGDLTNVAATNASVALTIVRPGTTYRVELDQTIRAARVVTATFGAIGMLNRLHHVRGVEHDYWVINAWGWLVPVVSIALFILASSGVVMWFQRHRARRLGTIVFAAGLAWGVTLLILIRTA